MGDRLIATARRGLPRQLAHRFPSMTTPRPPRCALASPTPAAWRVTVSPPDGGGLATLPLMAVTRTEAALTAMELAGPGSLVRRVERQGEWV